MFNTTLAPQFRPSLALLDIMADDGLRNRVENYLDRVIRPANNGWYAEETLSFGHKAAEAKLTEWVKSRGLNAYANAVSEVAEGLLALARFDDTCRRAKAETSPDQEPDTPIVRVIRVDKSTRIAGADNHQGGWLVLATNPNVPGCNCSQPAGSSYFGRGGDIGLQSVGIMVDRNWAKPELILHVPLPSYRGNASSETRMGFATISINTEGHASGQATHYYLYVNVFDFALGTIEAKDLIEGSTMMSGVNAALDFPGAEAYLADCISHLGPYLENAAAKLSGQHNH